MFKTSNTLLYLQILDIILQSVSLLVDWRINHITFFTVRFLTFLMCATDSFVMIPKERTEAIRLYRGTVTEYSYKKRARSSCISTKFPYLNAPKSVFLMFTLSSKVQRLNSPINANITISALLINKSTILYEYTFTSLYT